MNQIVVKAYIQRAIDRKTVAFAVKTSHAKNLAEELKSRGIASEAIYGGMPTYGQAY